ncbi:MAG TPA: PEGA domain-containing protein [Blastocatellia bacterium]|jgi:tetratricopeptide (TPR) repeat protein|nr:PEGA domain-containing protein [Blastocatellia bacterium]
MNSAERHAGAAEAERSAEGEVNQTDTEFDNSAADLSPIDPEAPSQVENTGLEASQGYIPGQNHPVGLQQQSISRLRATATGFAVIVALLTVAGVYLITKKPSTVDQLVILTVPSGAEITLGSKEYGHSPVKLEKVPIGNYTLTMTKEGFEARVEQITVSESQPFELMFRLKPIPPMDAAASAPEEQIRQYQQGANDAFAVGRYAIPYDLSALFYVDLILQIDGTNQVAAEMRDRIRKTLHQSAQGAAARGDLGRAQEIYQFLGDFYPGDEETRVAAAKLENQLSARRGEVRDLVAKAQEALDAGRFADPDQSSAYYYSKQALARDRQNVQARAIRDRVKETLADQSQQAYRHEEIDTAIKRLERATSLFPEDKEMRTRLHEWMNQRAEEVKAANDPVLRRRRGLDLANREDCAAAIPDLEFAISGGTATADVMIALAGCHYKSGHLELAASYYRKVPESAGEAYRTAVAAQGDIAMARTDTSAAVAQYKKALQLGGSTRYSPAILQDKIDRIEKKQREKAAEPTALTIQVKHLHGKLRGSCSGTLSVTAKGVRYDGKDAFAANLSWTNVVISKDKFTLQIQGKSMDFTAAPGEAERFQEALGRYQAAISR